MEKLNQLAGVVLMIVGIATFINIPLLFEIVMSADEYLHSKVITGLLFFVIGFMCMYSGVICLTRGWQKVMKS